MKYQIRSPTYKANEKHRRRNETIYKYDSSIHASNTLHRRGFNAL